MSRLYTSAPASCHCLARTSPRSPNAIQHSHSQRKDQQCHIIYNLSHHARVLAEEAQR